MSINIFYYEKCTFEYDYFRNVIFKDYYNTFNLIILVIFFYYYNI